MSASYIIQPGDTLLGIAINQYVDFNELLALNPQYQSNPNLIHIGETLSLPEPTPEVETQPICPIEPVEPMRPISNTGKLEEPPQCKGVDIQDILFQTDERGQSFYCIDEASQSLLEQEIGYTEQLINGYQQLLSQAPDAKSATEQSLTEHAAKKKQWAEDAVKAGAIAVQSSSPQVAGVVRVAGITSANSDSSNQQRVNAKIKELEQRQRFIQYYVPPFLHDDESLHILRKQTLAAINKEIDYYTTLSQAQPTPQEPKVGKLNLDNFASSKTLTTTPAKRHVVELFSVSRNRMVYVRAEFLEREKRHWKRRNISEKMLSSLKSGNAEAFKQAILSDIKNDITKDIASPKIEAVIKEWKADGGNAGEWKASHYILNEDGQTRFATSSEAQLLRWGMGAAIKSTVEPSQGKIDIGISAQAKVALAEAAVKFEAFLPYEAGFPLSLSYTDVNKQPQVHSFGRFRARGCLTMSCFVGAMGEVKAEASNQREEQTAGHSVLLSPSIGMGERDGRVGVKAEGFAGAQVGGELTGGLEWQNPDKTHSLNFDTLAEVKAEGNVAFGAGAGADFQLDLRDTGLYFHCHGRLVWGPGGSGGFGATVNFETIWDLAQVVWQGLQYVDYRELRNVNGLMYEYLRNASYMAFAATEIITNPNDALKNAVLWGVDEVNQWWRVREARQDNAHALSKRILNQQAWSGVNPDSLQPETIGIMLDVLVEDYAFSFDEYQEHAIIFLLGRSVLNWRKFTEVLARMNPEGEKQNTEGDKDKALFTNLARLNAILDNKQQQQFNHWLQWLAENNDVQKVALLRGSTSPFEASTAWTRQKKIEQVRQQYAALKIADGSRYV